MRAELKAIQCVGCGYAVFLLSLEEAILLLGWEVPGGEPLCKRCVTEISEDLERTTGGAI